MSDDDTKTLEVAIEYPAGRPPTEIELEVPDDLSRDEAKEWAAEIFFEHCHYGFNATDFDEEVDDG